MAEEDAGSEGNGTNKAPDARRDDIRASPVRRGWLFWTFAPPFDTLICILPLLFVAYAGVSRYLDGVNVEDQKWGLKLVAAAKYVSLRQADFIELTVQGVTVYTILFSTILGRSIDYIASWVVERGASVFFLEQLLGSVSIFQTIKTQWMLRSLNFTSLTLIALWALSPIGGQSALRLLSVVDSVATTADSVFVRNIAGLWLFDEPTFNTGLDPYVTFSVVFGGSISGSYKSISQDTWGNLRVPYVPPDIVDRNYDFVELDQHLDDRDVTVDLGPARNITLLTTAGVPFRKLGGSIHYRFLVRTPYFPLTCGEYEPLNSTGSHKIPQSSSWGLVPRDEQNNSDFRSLTWYWRRRDADGPNPSNYVASSCNLTAQTVEMDIDCFKSTCTTLRYRKVLSTDTVNLPSPETGPLVRGFLQGFSSALSSTRYTDRYSVAECYTYFGSFKDCLLGEWPPGVTIPDFQVLGQRISQLFNSYWIVSQAGLDIMGLENGNSSTEIWSNRTSDIASHTSYPSGYIKIKAKGDSPVRRYAYHPVWFFWLIFSSLILFIVAVAGTALKYSRSGPELLGHVSTLTRDNDISVSETGSWMDGYERARGMKDVYIRLIDAAPEASTGKLVLSSTKKTASLRRRRNYQ